MMVHGVCYVTGSIRKRLTENGLVDMEGWTFVKR